MEQIQQLFPQNPHPVKIMKQEPNPIGSVARAARKFSFAVMACFRSIAFVLIAFGLPQSAFSDITMSSYWQLGEGATVGLDASSANDGEVNNFNNSAGTVVNSATPSSAAGSTAYATTSGANFQGLWMFGAGSNNQTVPADDWGVQFQVRVLTLPTTGTFKPVYGMRDASSGGLVIEANNIGGTTYFDVNRSGQANLIIPRNASTTVTANTWYDLALVRSGGVLTFYVNGVSVGTSSGSIGTTDGLLALGFKQGVGTGHLNADFDEARFFTFAPGTFNASVDLIMTRRTVTYAGNGNTGGSEPTDSNSPYFPGTSVTVLGAGTLTKTGFIFTGWNTMADGSGTSYSPTATFSSPNADTTLHAQWAVATATITAPGTFPAAVSTTYGSASTSTSVAVSGSSLSADIIATAPDNLEVSSDNITFGSTATFTQIGGSASGTLYVRIKETAPVSSSPYDSQSITLTSPGALAVNVATTASGNTVTPKTLTIPTATAQSKMHDGTTDGIVIGELQASEPFGSGTSGDGAPYDGDTLTVSAPGTFSSSAVGGPYPVTAGTFTLGGSSAENYTLSQPSFSSLTASILSAATWTEPFGGSWTDSVNWQDNVVGAGANNTADFSMLDLTFSPTVTLASPQTIGGLVFGDNTTPDNNWTLSGSILTLAATTPPVINVINQTTTISSALASANGMVKTGSGTLALSSITSGTMDLTANDGTLILAVPFGGLAFNNAGGLANGGVLTANSGTTLQISGAYNIGYNQAVNINGGSLDLANNSSGDGQNYTLNLSFSNGGFIYSSTNSSLRWGELANATITVNGTTPATISSILRMIPGNSRTGTINVVDASGNLNFSGNIIDYPGIPGGVPLIKTGAGTLTLAGTNNYTSTTTVSGGTLAVTGSLGATAVTVQANATLSGNGNIGGSVTIDSDAHHSLAVEATTGTHITRTITGALTLTAGNILDLTAAAPPAAGVYVLVTATGGITGTPTVVNLTGVTGTVAVNGNNLELTVGGGSTYATWIDGFTFAPGADETPTGDPDNDGIDNAAEMVLGGDPATAMDVALAPTVQLVTTDLGAGSTNYLLFTFRRTDLSVTAAVTSGAQYGTDLSNWTTAVDGVDGVVVQVDDNFSFVPASPNTDRVRVYVPRGSNTKLFGRLNVTVP